MKVTLKNHKKGTSTRATRYLDFSTIIGPCAFFLFLKVMEWSTQNECVMHAYCFIPASLTRS